MAAKLSINYTTIVRKIKKRIKKRFFIFLFFLFISALFWVLNTLSQNFTTNITYPIAYTGLPQNKHLVKSSRLPNKLQLSVTAFGFSLMRYKLSSQPLPIVLNLKELDLKKVTIKDSVKYFILTKNITENISKQISSDFKINTILPDSLIFSFARTITRKIAIKPDSNYTIAKQYMQTSKIVLYPDSLSVSGANHLIDSLKYIRTRPIQFENLNQTYYGFFGLQRIPDVFYNSESVLMQIPVEKYTERRARIPILIKNPPANAEIQIFPSSVNIKYHVAIGNYYKISDKDFSIYVDCADIMQDNNNSPLKLRIYLHKFPSQISSFDFAPKFVEYLIIR